MEEVVKEPQEPEIKDSTPPEEQQAPVETPEEINWRKVREAQKEKDRALEEERAKAKAQEEQMASMRQALEAALAAKGAPALTQSQQDQMIADLMEEDIPTGGEIKKYLKQSVPNLIKSAIKEYEAEQAKARQEQEIREIPVKLVQRHTDYGEVVNNDTVAYLEYHYPHVAKALSVLPESLEKWEGVYETIKKLVPTIAKADQGRIDNNLAKPQRGSVPSANTNETGSPRRLSQEEKDANWKRLQQLAGYL